jgi:FkbM family methyltransferase
MKKLSLKGLGLRKLPLVNRALSLRYPSYILMHGMRLNVDRMDFSMTDALFNRKFEPGETFLAKQILTLGKMNGGTFVDLGANIGYYTTLFGQFGDVYSFEPAPRAFKMLQRNIHGKGRIHAFNIAISDKKGEALLYQNDYNHGDNRIFPSFDVMGIPIQTDTLDNIVPEGTQISLLKMDIQGAECLALRGARRVLVESPNLHIISECWPAKLLRAETSVDEYFDLLKEFQWGVIDEQTGEVVQMSRQEFDGRFNVEDWESAANLHFWK